MEQRMQVGRYGERNIAEEQTERLKIRFLCSISKKQPHSGSKAVTLVEITQCFKAKNNKYNFAVYFCHVES